ncbi:MAG: PrsW family glutamic-type intramembrane protease [Pyrinomonadaceae bacterium]|nr:PrsW family glutamic-type intramembrane protease [Pyrinomonadaceae bacterium]MCX7640611.1 PrsW family glutamic-type intramembrane protease [Pyrinomonadaceae bacterium]MDW8305161.1 PrsW family glutamic-type intramembrane protease [Acidobacteriota bacterium]
MKLRLKVLNGTLAGEIVELEKGVLTIGRDHSVDLRFAPEERVVSSRHAIIEAKNDGFYATDTNSTNGTYVNGQRIQSVKLSDGDIISLGRQGVNLQVEIESQRDVQPQSQSPSFDVYQSYQPQFEWKKSVSYIGLSRPHEMVFERPSKSSTKYVFVGITVFAIVFLSLIVTVMIVTSVGIIPAFIAAIVAFVPACIYILPLIFLDRYDPEPIWLLALAFAWGALVAVIFSAFVNTAIGVVLGPLVAAVVSAPIFEEASKGIGLIILLVFFRREFDDILDGIVFGGIIALGFATVENVLYYGRALVEGGLSGLAITFFLRGALSPFAHVTFTAMTGIGCGISRESHNKLVRIIAPVIGYFAAVFLHALWNTMASIGLGAFLLGYLILEIPFFLGFVGFCIYVARRQNKILREMLAIDVARGLITEEQMRAATSIWKGITWILAGISSGKLVARWKFLRAVGKLGLSYWHIKRAQAAQGHTISFQQNPIFREEVLRLQAKI